MTEVVDVAVVGGGPAGAALAIRLARAGIETVLVERRLQPAWRAGGVFSSPLTRRHLRRLGFADADVRALNRPIAALNLETTRGVHCRIEYGHGFACGFDRLALEAALLDRAATAGAALRSGTVVRDVELPAGRTEPARLALSATAGTDAPTSGRSRSLAARIVVGADGSTSLISRAARVYGTHRRFDRAGITFHRSDPSAPRDGEPMDGRFVFGDGWYVGIAPVPASRVNIGIVVPAIRNRRPADVADSTLASIPGAPEPWMAAPTTDRVVAAGRLEHHARRASGPGWLLVGDAIGFLDPLTGEGLLRAFVSAELAAEAITRTLRGDQAALDDYDRRVRENVRGKNLVSWMVQLFLARPAAFDYALKRLATRGRLRDELTLVLTDQRRPSRVVNPRFLAQLLAP